MTNKEFIKILKRFPSGAVLKDAFMEYDDVTLDIVYTDTDGIEFSVSIPILTKPADEETPKDDKAAAAAATSDEKS